MFRRMLINPSDIRTWCMWQIQKLLGSMVITSSDKFTSLKNYTVLLDPCTVNETTV